MRIDALATDNYRSEDYNKINKENKLTDLTSAKRDDEVKDSKTGRRNFDQVTLEDRYKNTGCETCKNRRYQDESDDSGVSFQSPTAVAPEAAAAKVRGHEQEHVANEQYKAKQEGKEIVSQNVQIYTDICQECSKTYVSGGVTTTTTMTRGKGQQAVDAYSQMQNAAQEQGQDTTFDMVA